MTKVSRDLESQGAVANAAMFRIGAKYSEKTGQLKAGSFLVAPGSSMEEMVAQVTTSGASSCGTEIVYRVGITRVIAEVRELDPASNKFVERAEFQLGGEETPVEYSEKRSEPDTRYRIALAEGVTSWQVVEALKAMDVLDGEPGERPAEGMLAPDSYEVVPGT